MTQGNFIDKFLPKLPTGFSFSPAKIKNVVRDSELTQAVLDASSLIEDRCQVGTEITGAFTALATAISDYEISGLPLTVEARGAGQDIVSIPEDIYNTAVSSIAAALEHSDGEVINLIDTDGNVYTLGLNSEKTDIINHVSNIESPVTVSRDGNNVLIHSFVVSNASAGNMRVTSFFSLLSSQLESLSQNQVLHSVTTWIKDRADLTIDGLKNAIDSAVDTSKTIFASVTATARRLIYGFSTGGFVGLVKTILSFFRTAASISATDGVLSFTDVSALVPTQYIAGAVVSLLGTVATVASTIVAAFAPIVGIIGAVLGGLVMQIPKALSYDFNTATNAEICSIDEGLPLDCSPIPFFQRTTSGIMSAAFAPYREWIDATGVPIALHVPGGLILIGTDSTGSNYNYEFHPSLDDYSGFLSSLGFKLSNTDPSSHQPSGNEVVWMTGDSASNWKVTKNVGNLRTAFDLTNSASLQALNDQVIAYSGQNAESGVLSDYDDALLRHNIMSGLMTFIIACYALDPQVNPTQSLAFGGGVTTNNMIFTGHPTTDWTYKSIITAGLTSLLLYNVPFHYDNSLKIVTPAGSARYCIQPLSWNQITLIAQRSAALTATEVNDVMYPSEPSQPGYYFLDWVPFVYVSSTSTSGNLYNGLNAGLITQSSSLIWRANSTASNISFAFNLPKYEKSSFWLWVGIFIGLAIVAAGVATFAAVKVSMTRKRLRTQLSSKVEQMHTTYTENPTPENYKAYKKAVIVNNMTAALTGGTTFAVDDFWGFNKSSDDGATISTFSTLMDQFDSSKIDDVSAYTVDVEDSISTSMATGYTQLSNELESIVQLIRGPEPGTSD